MLTTPQHRAAVAIRQVLATRDRDWLTTKEAAELAGISDVAMLGWYRRYGSPLAYKVGGRWRVNPDNLGRILSGQSPLAVKTSEKDDDTENGQQELFPREG